MFVVDSQVHIWKEESPDRPSGYWRLGVDEDESHAAKRNGQAPAP